MASGHMAPGHTASGHTSAGAHPTGTHPAGRTLTGPHGRTAAGSQACGNARLAAARRRPELASGAAQFAVPATEHPRTPEEEPGTGRNGRAGADIWGADTRGHQHGGEDTGGTDTGGTDTGGVDTVGERTGLILGQEILDGPPHTAAACPPPPARHGTAAGGAMFPGSWPVTARNPAGASSSWGAGWTRRFGRATAVRSGYLMNSGGTRGGQCPTVSMPREWARATRAARLGALSFRSMRPTWYSTPCRLR